MGEAVDVNMSSPRIEKLRKLAGQRPEDPFPIYALALEYRNLLLAGDAEECFSRLLISHPDYLPAYLQYGQFLVDLGRTEEAAGVLRTGADLAERQHDSKAQSEIAALLDELD
jgi:tetratricopeptide (TPR) repeat protein